VKITQCPLWLFFKEHTDSFLKFVAHLSILKDLFSTQSSEYSRFRPTYPAALVEEISSLCAHHDLAWDAGTGNGQLAVMLAEHFKHVTGTDISEKQLANAAKKSNIDYSISDSKTTAFKDHSVDLVTVAQAVHWFDFDAFYAEVKRVLKKNGVIALIGYGVMRSDRATDAIIQDFYHNIVGPYWDQERRLIDEAYVTIPFPFKEIGLKKYNMHYSWNIDQLMGYFSTWSALQHYLKKTAHDPLPELKERFVATGHKKFELDFPLFFRIGKPE
jgi:ubiquinone/menaquinone biosynthesis C-methylase UbiE